MKYLKTKLKRFFREKIIREYPLYFFSQEDVYNYIGRNVKYRISNKIKNGVLTDMKLVENLKGEIIEIIVSIDYRTMVSYKNCYPY